MFSLARKCIMMRHIWLCAVFCLSGLYANGQFFSLKDNRKSVDIPFKFLRNLVIIQLNINNKGPYNFVLDTGVGLMIITDSSLADSINIAGARKIKLTGLGDDDEASEAIVTPALNVDIRGLVSNGVSAAILKTDIFNLSGYTGVPVHGLIGYDFFNSLAVKINFNDSILTVYPPGKAKLFKKSQRVPITIEDNKPYLQAYITMPDGSRVLNKLIVDLGAGHPVSLESSAKKYGDLRNKIPANLGIALNGPIFGYIGRIKEVEIGKYKLKDVIASFPDENYEQRTNIPRDGNIGAGILKKFNLLFDYSNNALYLKPNNNFKAPFEHDMSGIEYYLTGNDLSHMLITRIAPDSPADEIGLLRGDEIVSINFKPIAKMTAGEIDNIFKTPGRSLLLEIFHDGKHERVVINLRRRI